MAQSQSAYEKSVRRAIGIGARCKSKHSRRNTPSGSISCGFSPLATSIAREVRELVKEGHTKEEARDIVGAEARGRFQCLIVHIKRALPLWDEQAHNNGADRSAFRLPGAPSDRDYCRALFQWIKTVPNSIVIDAKKGTRGYCWIVNPNDAAHEYLSWRDIPETGIVELRAPTQVLERLQVTHPDWMETYSAPLTARVAIIAQGATASSAAVDEKLKFMKRERIDYVERVAFSDKAERGEIPAYHGALPAPAQYSAPAAHEPQYNPNTVAIVASILPGADSPETVQVNVSGTVRTVYAIVAEYLATRETHPGHATELAQIIGMIAQGERVILSEIESIPPINPTEEMIVANQSTIGNGIHFRREHIRENVTLKGTVSKGYLSGE